MLELDIIADALASGSALNSEQYKLVDNYLYKSYYNDESCFCHQYKIKDRYFIIEGLTGKSYETDEIGRKLEYIPKCNECVKCSSNKSKKHDGYAHYCSLTGEDVEQSHFGKNSPKSCPRRR